MLDDFMGNLSEQQAEMKQKLQNIPIEIKIEGITISGNGAREVKSVTIDNEILKPDNKEMVEDLFVIAINKFIEQSVVAEEAEAKKMMSSMLPPEFGDLFK